MKTEKPVGSQNKILKQQRNSSSSSSKHRQLSIGNDVALTYLQRGRRGEAALAGAVLKEEAVRGGGGGRRAVHLGAVQARRLWVEREDASSGGEERFGVGVRVGAVPRQGDHPSATEQVSVDWWGGSALVITIIIIVVVKVVHGVELPPGVVVDHLAEDPGLVLAARTRRTGAGGHQVADLGEVVLRVSQRNSAHQWGRR